MIDIQILRKEPERLLKALASRGAGERVGELKVLDEEHRRAIGRLEELLGRQNRANEEIARAKKSGQDATKILTEMKDVAAKAAEAKKAADELGETVRQKLLVLPNLPLPEVPAGPDASANRVVRTVGEAPQSAFERKTHQAIGDALGILDLDRASKITGSSFVVFKGDGARLERALIQFMLDLHTREHGYAEVSTPFLVRRASVQGTGQLPKFEEDLYRIYRGSSELEDSKPREDDLFLIPTAEVPVTNLHRDEILDEAQLPIAYVAYSPCFRLEAGTYGKDTKGMIRVHQFDKVELVRFCRPEESEAQHELLLGHAEKVLQLLGLPYRVVLLATGDMGFSAAKCYDIEIWASGTGRWLEASSCSNFTDFQARRARIRYKEKSGGKPKWVHTLNGSGVALARTFVAVLENYQQADGSVLIPEVLRPYMGGQTHICSHKSQATSHK